jgi:hydroxypyruvate reductase
MSPTARRPSEPRTLLLECFGAALRAVDGRRAVLQQLERDSLDGQWHVVAIGKAAGAMAAGALDGLGRRVVRALVVTVTGGAAKLDALQRARIRIIESAHPRPDERSLLAGQAVVEFVTGLPRSARLLWLISGGASSLVEVLSPGITLTELQRVNDWLLGSGLGIASVNEVRRRMSRLKGGGLAVLAAPRPGLAFMISDVPTDDPAVIGSGLLHRSRRGSRTPRSLPGQVADVLARCPDRGPVATPRVPACIVASNRHARAMARQRARDCGCPTVRAGRVEFAGDAVELGQAFARRIAAAAPGTLLIWGGESTVTLPANPGRGGRNQQLALAAAVAMAGKTGLTLLAAGTDGIDGASEDAGAIVDGTTCVRGAATGLDPSDHLARADAGTYLDECGELVHTGPTGTNVGDLVFALKDAAR